MPAWLLPAAGAVLSAGGALLANRASAKAAKENREWQERMSSTAHEREVADLRRAGLNPILSANHGASSPGGATADVRDVSEAGGRGVASALAIRQAKASIELTNAQAAAANAAGQLSNAQAGDIVKSQPGRLSLVQAQAAVASADAAQRRELLPMIIEQAKAEIGRTLSGAKAAEAAARLDEAALAGARNVEELQKALGMPGAWMELLVRTLRGIR